MITNTFHSIDKDFVVLGPDKKATLEPFDSGLYQRLGKEYKGFKGHELISCHEFDRDWSSWEMHPNGDEVVILLSGSVTMVLQVEAGESCISLGESGSYVVVPKGVWHTARTDVPAKMLFVTPGEGTEHRDM